MRETKDVKEKAKLFITILIPILITQAGLSLITFLDTVMSGKVSAADLAGVAIGSSLWTPVYTGLAGILTAVTPIVAQLMGGKQQKDVPYTVVQSIYVAVILSLLVIFFGFFIIDPILETLQLEDKVSLVAHQYLLYLGIGILPLFVYNVMRSFIDSLGKTRVTMLITLCALPINFVLNYLFIFGNFGFPKLGGAGAGLASGLTYWCICLISLLIVHRKTPFYQFKIFGTFYSFSLPESLKLLKIGLPIGFAIFFETSIFAAVTLLMSHFDTVTIASHQAAMNFASLLYMLPLSVSMTLTIVVGFEAGAKRFEHSKAYSYLGISIAVGFSLFTAFVILLFRQQIAGMYTGDPDVLHLTKHFLLYALFFQLSDAIAAPIQGALRGYKDVNYTLVTALVSYWIIGLPAGFVIGTYTSFGAYGYWIGLITGLAAGAAGLFLRLRLIQSRLIRQHG
ncbi:MATE family efflux transporter [Bacillus sonorensis]|uniref:Probable multidrug resistance protein NorM n=2 Tax=Bacillus sonorensis TaxID=119858 RepID=M5PHW5_9BACI|nr:MULTISPECIES: MATE family efflux transporter [Bacillus]TWK82410.1 Multidrug resistance protein NorM [Bacillus paralicheniformis]ASB88848.1 putative multidrug resistance protein NorM [Bacillus sonorensis]EME76342.1 multidrug efflux protein [Bacillus sonorensis L12]MCZ0072162.1 MATE family efflux transporter [Bacillus sonorensis]MCZ0090782.1 MATE family efflux transporter [Bacillus sonorensis]